MTIELEHYARTTKSFKVKSNIRNSEGKKIWASVMEVPMSYIYLVVAGFPNPSGTGTKAAKKLFKRLIKDEVIAK